ncbi:MAG: CHAT domain-containing protein [Kofleriaceae bacterium]
MQRYREAPEDLDASSALGATLFTTSELGDDGHPLVVMSDSPLSDVQLAGLRLGGRFLIERTSIVEVLSPELLFTNEADAAGSPLVLGDPTSDLRGGLDEAKLVASLVGVEPMLQSLATRRALLSIRRPSVLHVAAHSRVEHGRAEILLADGAMSSTELLNAAIAPRVAVIASCNSGRGDDPSVSLVAVFLANGSEAVIGAKRPLDDRESTGILVDFYRNNGVNKPAQALATAQRLAIRRGVAPHVWAALAVFGR